MIQPTFEKVLKTVNTETSGHGSISVSLISYRQNLLAYSLTCPLLHRVRELDLLLGRRHQAIIDVGRTFEKLITLVFCFGL